MSVIFSTIFRGIRYMLFFCLAIVLIVIGAFFFSRTMGVSMFTVLSGSMEPAIKTGSLIVVVPQDEYHVGDIVTRRTGKNQVTITHRVVEEVEKDGKRVFHTKGDTNNLVDGDDILPSDIVGKVLYIVPYAGYPMNFSKSRQGFILLIVIPMTFIIFDETLNIYKEWGKIKQKKLASQESIVPQELRHVIYEKPSTVYDKDYNVPRQKVTIGHRQSLASFPKTVRPRKIV